MQRGLGGVLANRFDVKWVMSQVGHADSKMTLDVYAQREHGVRFDALVSDARVQLHGAQIRPEKATKRRRGADRPAITARDE
jgi:hypothetical protein